MDQPSYFRIYEFHTSLVNFIIPIYSQSTTIYNFVESFLTTYSTESSDCGNYEIHSHTKKFLKSTKKGAHKLGAFLVCK